MKPKRIPAVRCRVWLGAIKRVTLSELGLLLRLLLKPVTQPFLIALLKGRYFFLKARVKFLMYLCKARIICLQRGYLTGNEANLRTNRVLCRACVNHPVEVVKVFLECFHIVCRDLAPNVPDQRPRASDGRPGT